MVYLNDKNLTFSERPLFNCLSNGKNGFDEDSHTSFRGIDPTNNTETEPLFPGTFFKLWDKCNKIILHSWQLYECKVLKVNIREALIEWTPNSHNIKNYESLIKVSPELCEWMMWGILVFSGSCSASGLTATLRLGWYWPELPAEPHRDSWPVFLVKKTDIRPVYDSGKLIKPLH